MLRSQALSHLCYSIVCQLGVLRLYHTCSSACALRLLFISLRAAGGNVIVKSVHFPERKLLICYQSSSRQPEIHFVKLSEKQCITIKETPKTLGNVAVIEHLTEAR